MHMIKYGRRHMECAYDYGPPAADASGFWTALTSLTVLTADKIDEVDLIGV